MGGVALGARIMWYMHDVNGCAWCRGWQQIRKGGAPGDGVRGGHKWGGRATLGIRREGRLVSTSAKRGRILMRGGHVGSIPADPDPKTSTLSLCNKVVGYIKKGVLEHNLQQKARGQ